MFARYHRHCIAGIRTSIAASVLINEPCDTPRQRVFIHQVANSLLVDDVLHQLRCRRWRWRRRGKGRPQFWSHDCTISCIIVTIVVYGLLSIVYCLVSIVSCLLSLVYCRCLLSLVYCLLSSSSDNQTTRQPDNQITRQPDNNQTIDNRQ